MDACQVDMATGGSWHGIRDRLLMYAPGEYTQGLLQHKEILDEGTYILKLEQNEPILTISAK